MDIPTYDHLW